MTLELFYVYANQDLERQRRLDNHFANVKRIYSVNPWHDRRIEAGRNWAQTIEYRLNAADIILLLVSADFMGSEYCSSREMRRALERHEEKTALVIPILIRPVYLVRAPFSHLQMLPDGLRPVASWPNEDEAYVNIVEGVCKSIDAWLLERPVLPTLSGLTLPSPQPGPIPPLPQPEQTIQPPIGNFSRFLSNLKNASPRKKAAMAALALVLCILLVLVPILHSAIFSKGENSSHPGILSSSPITPSANPITPSSDLVISTQIQNKTIDKESIEVGIAPKGQNKIFNTTDNKTAKCIDDENAQIRGSFVTVVVVTTLSKTNNDQGASSEVGKEELQGLCLWQDTYLKSQPKIPVWIVVANLGTKETDVLNGTWEDVNKQIIQFAKDNKNFIGVVGFSFSLSVSNAMDELNMQHIPVVSDAASSSDFSQKDWPYFHRVVPDDYTEGSYDADYAINTLKAQTAYVFSDTDTPQPFGERGNSYSKTLGRAFQDKFERGGGTVIPETYSVSKGGTFVSGINKMLTEMQRNPSVNTASTATHTIIFCACYADDFTQFQLLLSQASQELQIALPENAVFMGGEALYELGAFHNNYKNFYFTAFAYPDTDSTVACEGKCQGEPVRFSSDYCTKFSNSSCPPAKDVYGVSRPGPHTIQAYDALSVLQQAYDNAQPVNSREDLQLAFSSLAFQGISGYIDFTNPHIAASDPNNKAVLVICVNSSGSAQLLYIYGQFVLRATSSGTPIQSACKQ